jgi:c-di-GMP-binding flagellar brake protein YcgR
VKEQNSQPEDLHLLHDFGKVGKSFFLPVSTPLQVELNGIITKMSSVAVGYSQGEYLIIKYPSAKGLGPISHKLTKGGRITIRFLSEGNVFAFQSEVIAIINEPYRLILITYPSLIARHSLRNSKRVDCYLPASLRPLQTKLPVDKNVVLDVVYEGIIIDVSRSGCDFEMIEGSSEQPLSDVRMNDPVLLYLTLPGSEEKKELRGHVKRIRRDTRRIATGIQFDEIDEETERSLAEYISTLERYIQAK